MKRVAGKPKPEARGENKDETFPTLSFCRGSTNKRTWALTSVSPPLHAGLAPQPSHSSSDQTQLDPSPRSQIHTRDLTWGSPAPFGSKVNVSSWHSPMERLVNFPTRGNVAQGRNRTWHHEYSARIKMHYGLYRVLWATCMENVIWVPKYVLEINFWNKIFPKFGNIYVI